MTTYNTIVESLNPCSYGISFLTLANDLVKNAEAFSLNPCSYGISFLTCKMTLSSIISLSLNPCSYGISFLTPQESYLTYFHLSVLILVLMEYPF